MNAKQQTVRVLHKLLVAAGTLLAIGFITIAQVQTETKTAPIAAPTKTVKVERGTVVYVSGNNLVVKADDGTLRHFDNVPDTTTVTVGGQQLNVHQLKPGMQLERQTITTSTPRMITTVKTVTGTVWQVQPPNWVILRLEDNKNQRFKIPKGQTFNINGQETDAFGLRKGMTVNAQEVTEVPEIVVAQQVKRTGTMPPPPPAPQPDVAILVLYVPAPAPVQAAPAPAAPAPAEPVAQTLPKTGSYFPLIGLLGMLSIALGFGLKAVRIRYS
jgi:hypothetical protein